MMFLGQIDRKCRIGRSVYFARDELVALEREAEFVANLLRSDNKGKAKGITVSQIIRLKLFYTDYYLALMKKGGGL